MGFSQFKVLIIGLTAYLCGTVFVDRSNPKSAAEKINSVAQTLKKEKIKLWVFPEGTRNSDKSIDMLPFKKGAFHVASNADLPILPLGKFKYIVYGSLIIFLSVFHSDMRRQSDPLMKTPTRS